MPYIIVPKEGAQSREDEFDVEVSGSQLLVAGRVANALHQLSVRTAEDFVSFLDSFPSVFNTVLGWDAEDVRHARSNLVAELHGRVEDDILGSAPVRRRAYGARFPTLRKTTLTFGGNKED